MWKVDLYNKKIKIYQTINGLIILFIKPQFSIRCNQAFRPLYTSNFNIYLKLNFNPNGRVTYIIPDIFVSYRYVCIIPIRLMISDVYLAEVSIHPIKSGPDLRTCKAWKPLVYPLGGFGHSSQYPDIYRRQSWQLHKREVLVTSSRAFIHIAIKGCLSVIHPTTQ